MQYVAINHDKTEDILKIIDNYYKKFNFSLEEIAIGTRENEYMTVGKRFPSILKYREATNYGKDITKLGISTYFDIYEHVEENRAWIILSYLHSDLRFTLEAEEELLILLSEELQTKVLLYEHISVTDYLHLLLYEKGVIIDELVYESWPSYGKGFFEAIMDKDFESTASFDEKVVFPYLATLKLNFDAKQLHSYREEYWRRFFLNGKMSEIENFLKEKRYGTLELNPTKNKSRFPDK